MEYDDFTLVLPTLNEGKTVGRIIGYVLANYKGMSVVVADDGSGDETRKVTAGFARKSHGKVRFIDRKGMGRSRGLTASVVDGMLESRTGYVIVMDADLQHPPEVVGKIAKRLIGGDDLAVAYRERVTDWPVYRRLISSSFTTFGKMVLLLTWRSTCRDILSGYFGVRRKLFTETYKRNRERFVGDGYKVLFDMLKCVPRGGITVGEVPYTFHIRKHGESKASVGRGLALFKSFFS